jgi:hypothetical protein
MKTFPHTLVALLVLTGWAAAEVPRKAPITRYTGLWTNSPFTSKPPPPPPAETVNPLADYALAGVSPVSGGYRVTMINKKNPEERIVVDPNRASTQDFRILSVSRTPGDPLATTVRMAAGAVTGTVTFDEALLVLKAPPPPQVAQQAPPGAGAAPGGQQQTEQPGQRPPRSRVMPPPNGAGQVAPQQVVPPQRGGASPQGQQIRRPERTRR